MAVNQIKSKTIDTTSPSRPEGQLLVTDTSWTLTSSPNPPIQLLLSRLPRKVQICPVQIRREDLLTLLDILPSFQIDKGSIITDLSGLQASRFAAVVEKAVQRVHIDVLNAAVFGRAARFVICDAALDGVQDPGVEAEVGEDIDAEGLQDPKRVFDVEEVEDEHVVAIV
jgi:hypothetical protein